MTYVLKCLLFLTYVLGDTRIDDIINPLLFLSYIKQLDDSLLTCMRLFSDNSLKTSKCGKNISMLCLPLFCFYCILTASTIVY